MITLKSLTNKLRPFYSALVAWVAVGAFLLIIGDLLILPWFAGHFKGTVHVPQTIKLKPEQASEDLQKLKLLPVVIPEGEYSPSVPAGHILNQRPLAGTKVKKGRRVWLTISKGLKSVQVPVLKGNSLRQAEILLQQSGLRMGKVYRRYKPGIPKGVVYSASPKFKQEVETQSFVNVYVCDYGTEKHDFVPNLIGLSLNKVKPQLKKMGLELGKVDYKKSESYLPNTVIEQSPKASQIIGKKTVIRVVVSQP